MNTDEMTRSEEIDRKEMVGFTLLDRLRRKKCPSTRSVWKKEEFNLLTEHRNIPMGKESSMKYLPVKRMVSHPRRSHKRIKGSIIQFQAKGKILQSVFHPIFLEWLICQSIVRQCSVQWWRSTKRRNIKTTVQLSNEENCTSSRSPTRAIQWSWFLRGDIKVSLYCSSIVKISCSSSIRMKSPFLLQWKRFFFRWTRNQWRDEWSIDQSSVPIFKWILMFLLFTFL